MKKVLNLVLVALLVVSMALPVFAESAESVRQTGAPTVVEVEDKTVTVTVTSVLDQDKASWEVKQEMQAAAESLGEGDLTQVQSIQTAVAALNEKNAAEATGEEAPEEIKTENLVVSEVFHVDASQAGVAITFEAEGIKAGQFLMVMVFVDGEWVILDTEKVEILEDGKVRIIFENYGTVAFVVDKNEAAAAVAANA